MASVLGQRARKAWDGIVDEGNNFGDPADRQEDQPGPAVPAATRRRLRGSELVGRGRQQSQDVEERFDGRDNHPGLAIPVATTRKEVCSECVGRDCQQSPRVKHSCDDQGDLRGRLINDSCFAHNYHASSAILDAVLGQVCVALPLLVMCTRGVAQTIQPS